MIEKALHRTGDATPGPGQPSIAREHGKPADYLSNERTHLAYVRTAIALISLGITVNRFSLYLQQHDALPRRPHELELLGGTASAGFGMVIYALGLMLVALHRYRAVDAAITHGDFHSDHGLIMWLTLSVVAAGVAGILWMF